MNVNNKLYRLNFNQKPLTQQPKKEEEKSNVKESPSVKVPEAKPVTASIADIVAEMNKSMFVNPTAKGANDKGESDRADQEEDLVIDKSGGASIDDGNIGNVTMDELLDASAQVWNKVQELLDEHGMEYNVSIFGNILDGQENFENNIPYQNILYELGQQLSNLELTELQILVLKFEKMLSDYHVINPSYPLDKIKHSVFHGIAPFILSPNGLY